jgi:circadian clock protein KaiC
MIDLITIEKVQLQELPKTPTGIKGLDEITGVGLPTGRPTLIAGSAGCGKTLLAVEFLVRGATQFNEPGVFISFEETSQEIAQNVTSLGFDLADLEARGLLSMDYVHVEPSEIQETGEYDLEGLFIRLGYAIDSIGAKRVVLDTIEALFGGLDNQSTLRAEVRRLFRWLKDKGVTAVITGERGEGDSITRQGLEEFISDCVIVLDHRTSNHISSRHMRIVKYRGTSHGTNEYPLLIGESGISVLPITSLGLNHEVTNERVSTGVSGLDEMLEGKGFYRGSSILVSGTAGTGKTSLAASFAEATCLRGEKCLYFTFEESITQIVRNMGTIGKNLQPYIDQGLLKFQASRPTLYGLETHLAMIHKLVGEFKPSAVVIDPVTNFISHSNSLEVDSMLMRLIDFLKMEGITAFFTSLTSTNDVEERSSTNIASLIDTWLLLRDIEIGDERNRGIYVLKSRGMAHSNQIREFILSNTGIDLVEVYLGAEGVVTGSARVAREALERAGIISGQQELERKRLNLERKRKALEVQIDNLNAEFMADETELQALQEQERNQLSQVKMNRQAMARSRKAFTTTSGSK